MTAEPPRATPRPTQHATIAALIWLVADLLRGDVRPADYGRVILPFLVLRRLGQSEWPGTRRVQT